MRPRKPMYRVVISSWGRGGGQRAGQRVGRREHAAQMWAARPHGSQTAPRGPRRRHTSVPVPRFPQLPRSDAPARHRLR